MEFLERAISLARLGLTNTSPNPHVGAVIVSPDGRIIGEGFHRKCGEAHAEVNAVSSVRAEDRYLLKESTIYVTLEPCSHYGKTPPCAKLIVDTGIGNVVVGTGDPNPKVNGRGLEMMRRAGINVEMAEGDIAEKCRRLDGHFMSSFVSGRPYITLKWAQSADGFMASANGSPVRFSTPLTLTLVHKLRSEHDVILTTSETVIADNPAMDTRFWSAGKDPVKAVLDRNHRISSDARIFDKGETLVFDGDVQSVIEELGKRGFRSILVEAGPAMLGEFIRRGLYDSIRIEKSPVILGEAGGKKSPALPSDVKVESAKNIDGNTILSFVRIHKVPDFNFF